MPGQTPPKLPNLYIKLRLSPYPGDWYVTLTRYTLQSLTMAPPVKIGLMGYGSSTKIFHLPFILPNPDLEVVAFLQRAEAPKDPKNVEPGKHCTVDYPKAKHYRTPEEFLADKDIELVSVCTSSRTHYEFGVSVSA